MIMHIAKCSCYMIMHIAKNAFVVFYSGESNCYSTSSEDSQFERSLLKENMRCIPILVLSTGSMKNTMYSRCFTNKVVIRAAITVQELDDEIRCVVRDGEHKGFVPFRVTSFACYE